MGYPTFLYMPTPKTIIYNLPSTVLQQLGKIISLGIIYTYLEAYALISLAVLFVFNTAIGYKLSKLKMPDSILSTSLSMVQASASRKYCQVLKPVQVIISYIIIHNGIFVITQIVALTLVKIEFVCT